MTNSVDNRQAWRKSLFFLILATLFILGSVIYDSYVNMKNRPENITLTFQEEFSDAEKKLSLLLDSISGNDMLTDLPRTDRFLRENQERKFDFFFFKYFSDSLRYWSDNAAPMPETWSGDLQNNTLLQLDNGYYFYRDTITNDIRTVSLILIRSSPLPLIFAPISITLFSPQCVS